MMYKKGEYYVFEWKTKEHIVKLITKSRKHSDCWMCQIPKVITNNHNIEYKSYYVSNKVYKHRGKHYLSINKDLLSSRPVPRLKALLLEDL